MVLVDQLPLIEKELEYRRNRCETLRKDLVENEALAEGLELLVTALKRSNGAEQKEVARESA